MAGVRRQRADTERLHVKHSESIMTTYVERAQKQKLRDRRAAEMRLKNNRLGMNIFQISWIMAFVALVIVNWQLRFSYAQWPPAGVAPLDPAAPEHRDARAAIQFTLGPARPEKFCAPAASPLSSMPGGWRSRSA